MITGKIDLAKLTHVVTTKTGKDGKPVDCILIPIDKNYIFKGAKGGLYLDLVAFPLKEAKDNQTHLVKQSLPKDVRNAMSKEEQNAVPILGSLNITDGAQQNETSSPAIGEDDDLPF
jgi:hypothetical protein